MTRTPEFEDMRAEEWPETLRSLHRAAQNTYFALAELDATLSHIGNGGIDARGPIIALSGMTYTVLRDLRAEGLRQLAAWEHEQAERALVMLAANEIEWGEMEAKRAD